MMMFGKLECVRPESGNYCLCIPTKTGSQGMATRAVGSNQRCDNEELEDGDDDDLMRYNKGILSEGSSNAVRKHISMMAMIS
jgi:hypothetical protein